ncbi:MAG: LicD family protein [Bacteroidales bacterium]|mgnify:CR=1 FL=1|nr:LicD family protein [Bacteroidales bacterium]
MSKTIDLEELKKIQINILDAIEQFCTERKIRYSIGYGTLLGAVRHKGYIPWDDDLDIIMPYPDYQRFLQEFDGYKPYLQVQSMRKDLYYRFPFAKVFDNRTILIEKTIRSGVYVDIFPVVGFPETEEKFKQFVEEYHKNYLLMRIATKRIGEKPLKACFNAVKRCFYPDKDKIMQRIENIYSRYPFDEAEFAGVIPNYYKHRRYIKADIFRSYSTQTFEGKNYTALENYDAFLSATYGDYMTLPPEDKRHSEHVFKAYWKE